jgi:DNA-binding HxlR family transcriptional regulator
MKHKSFEHMNCPVALSLEHVGEWWNILILRDTFYGLSRFDEFQNSLGIAPNTLTRRLNELVEAGVLERRAYSDKPLRYDYLLTPRGREFRPVVLMMMAWGGKHFANGQPAIQLVDDHSGEPVELILTDARTGKPISFTTHSLRSLPHASEQNRWRMETGRERRQAYRNALLNAPTPSSTGKP